MFGTPLGTPIVGSKLFFRGCTFGSEDPRIADMDGRAKLYVPELAVTFSLRLMTLPLIDRMVVCPSAGLVEMPGPDTAMPGTNPEGGALLSVSTLVLSVL